MKLADRLLQGFFRRRLLSRAQDATTEVTRRRSLILAPHPDDEVLGCGGSILRKKKAGTDLLVMFATDGRHAQRSAQYPPAALARLREEEAREAGRRLGLNPGQLEFLRVEDGTLGSQGPLLDERIGEIAARFRPEEVMTPYRKDGHPDHEALTASALRLAAAGRLAVPILEYPVWFWHSAWWKPWRHHPETRPRVITVRIEEERESKRSALEAYRSQMERLDGSRDWMILPDVGGGRFLRDLIDSVEPFFCGP